MLQLIGFSAAMGWCGTPFPDWLWDYIRRHRKWSSPEPEPDWYTELYALVNEKNTGTPVFLRIALGAIGGILGGLIFKVAFGTDQLAAVGLAAYAGGRIIYELGAVVRK